MRRPVIALFPLLALTLTTLTGCGAGAVQVPVPAADQAATALCTKLAADLPAKVHGAERRSTSPSSPLVAAWGDPAIALRCGVPRPSADLAQARSRLVQLDDIAWLPTSDARPITFIAVGRQAYVEVTVPAEYQRNNPAGDVLLEFLPAIRAAIPPQPDNAL